MSLLSLSPKVGEQSAETPLTLRRTNRSDSHPKGMCSSISPAPFAYTVADSDCWLFDLASCVRSQKRPIVSPYSALPCSALPAFSCSFCALLICSVHLSAASSGSLLVILALLAFLSYCLFPFVLMSQQSSSPCQSPSGHHGSSSRADKHDVYDANIRNFAPVARIMKHALPENAKIAKEAKECMQECVSEFISFITSEGRSRSAQDPTLAMANPTASEKCQQEKRKTVNGEDILFAMTSLGFENYAEALKIYLSKYREVRRAPRAFPIPSHTLLRSGT